MFIPGGTVSLLFDFVDQCSTYGPDPPGKKKLKDFVNKFVL